MCFIARRYQEIQLNNEEPIIVDFCWNGAFLPRRASRSKPIPAKELKGHRRDIQRRWCRWGWSWPWVSKAARIGIPVVNDPEALLIAEFKPIGMPALVTSTKARLLSRFDLRNQPHWRRHYWWPSAKMGVQLYVDESHPCWLPAIPMTANAALEPTLVV